MYMNVNLPCLGAANTFYIVPPVNVTVLKAYWTANADPSTNKSVVISLNGGNTIITGDISATPGTVVAGTMTSTTADKNQVMGPSTTLSIKVVATCTNAVDLSLMLDLDEFVRKD